MVMGAPVIWFPSVPFVVFNTQRAVSALFGLLRACSLPAPQILTFLLSIEGTSFLTLPKAPPVILMPKWHLMSSIDLYTYATTLSLA
jgi:hypothetical protein